MNKRMKVLWVTNAFGCGGAERQMLYMYQILQRYSDFDITILYYAHVADELAIDNVNAIFIDKHKIGRIKTILSIANHIKKNDYDIMHAFGGCSANIYGRAGALLAGHTIPVGAMLGKRHFIRLPNRIMNSLLNLGGNWWTVNNAELIPILQRDLKFIDPEHIRMLHNGFVSDKEVNYHTNEVTEYDEDKGDSIVFCAVGRLQPIKNYGLFINAASIICRMHENVRFWSIGNGGEYDRLAKQIEELNIQGKVKLWGFRSDVDVALSRSDVFVQTSYSEGSPNTIAEAMRASKPIISTNSTDLSEMIENGKNGYVVKNDDLDSLVSAIDKLTCMTDNERKRMGEKSLELFNKFFLDVNVVKEIQSLYRQILSSTNKGA